MLLSLILADIRILSQFFLLLLIVSYCFLLFIIVFVSYCLVVPVVSKKSKVKLALAIPTRAPTTLVNEVIDTPPLLALEETKILSM